MNRAGRPALAARMEQTPDPRPARALRLAFPFLFAAALVATVAPLWVARALPAVDVPQHLFLIHVLGSLDDPSLPYQAIYQAHPGLTYLTFYYSVRALAALVGVEVALKVWLTLVLAGIPLSVLALLRALGRSPWLALLAFPLVYTDNFYWGLVSFQSSIPFTFLSLAAFVAALEAPLGSRRAHLALAGLALSLLALQLTHAAGMIFPAAALPLLLATTPSDTPRRLRALAALVPGVAVFLLWLGAGVGKGRQLGAPGEPWKASAPLFDRSNFVFDALSRKAARFGDLLANGFWSWADRPALYALAAVALLALAVAGRHGDVAAPKPPPIWARLRPALLLALALAFYALLPSDISGYMYYIYPRYAQVAALLAISVLPFPRGARATAVFAAAAAAVALWAGLHLAGLFRQFDAEAAEFEPIARAIPPHARVMHLVVDNGSRVATHAVYLHYAALGAMRADGVPSFSLAIDPSFPVGYRPGARPPASASEWRPDRFTWDQAQYYDVYLVRGADPAALFGAHRDEVEALATSGRWQLLRRKAAQ